jgi:hypothetical protein
MVRRALPCLAVLACVSAFIAPAAAQELTTDAPAHISRVDGRVTLEHAGEAVAAPLNMPVVAGDRLQTDDGRVEIMLLTEGTLAVDQRTSMDFQADDLVRLMDGRLRLTIPAPMRTASFRIDSPAGSVRIGEAGEYRVSILHGSSADANADETQIELAVVRGAADLFTDEGSTRVRPGERAYASAGLLPSYTYAFNSATVDDFDRWADGQPEVYAGTSAQYLPSDVREYSSTFDEYGDWRYTQPYGYVWYPRVAAAWRPYYYGRWMSYPRYGWTWVGADAFGWPTHHYGRWGFSAGVWFWIPSSRWAPAYVSWAYAPGYVSWCPLGFDNRPVIGIGINVGRRYYSPWNAWTVVSASHFGRGFVPQRVVRTAAWASGTHPAFRVRSTGPDVRDVAVPRYVNRGNAIVQSQTARPVAPQRDPTRTAAPSRGLSLSRGTTPTREQAVPRGQAISRGQATMGAPTRTPTYRSVRPSVPRSTVPSYRGSIPRSTVPIYRGSVPRSPSTSGYRTAPPAGVGSPARTRQTNPVYTPNYSPNYAPRYQPNYAPRPQPGAVPRSEPRQMPGIQRIAPREPATMRSMPRAGGGPAPMGSTMRGGSPGAMAPGAASGARTAPAGRAAPAGRGGAVAVPRRGGGGGN